MCICVVENFDMHFEPPPVISGRQATWELPDILLILQKELGLNSACKADKALYFTWYGNSPFLHPINDFTRKIRSGWPCGGVNEGV